MAQKVQVLMLDDLTGETYETGETVRFGLDGTAYEIDLSDRSAAELRDAFAKYVGAARKVGRVGMAPARTARRTSDVDTKAVRAWANARGLGVSERGRIPADVVEKFKDWERMGGDAASTPEDKSGGRAAPGQPARTRRQRSTGSAVQPADFSDSSKAS